ncbi:amidohydrolase family protein [Spirosoma sp. HMF4905]|uniref:Amidohydrolase family protein n=1 Tax=Spirosoma arboris TaxID=2682092 RepID=A0A7K1SBU6_9BACT|nr:amidohydrolase family protein [Spirosoma arboris]MVM31148.1 amidohydrolase family protein [Spirosoma arboris]
METALFTRWPSGKIPEAWLKPNLSESFWDAAFKTLPVEDYIRAMLEHKTILDPTVFIDKNGSTNPARSQAARVRTTAHWEIDKRFTKLALDRGVPVCTGTDTDKEKFVQQEIKTLVHDCGFSPMQAIVSATKHDAMALGIDDRTGTIQPGKIANLVILSANPAENIDNLDKVALVIKNGRMFNAK